MSLEIDHIIARATERAAERFARDYARHAPVPRAWLGTKDAATYLGCDADWLEKLRRNGEGPRWHRRAGRFIRYAVSDLDAWLRTGETGGGR